MHNENVDNAQKTIGEEESSNSSKVNYGVCFKDSIDSLVEDLSKIQEGLDSKDKESKPQIQMIALGRKGIKLYEHLYKRLHKRSNDRNRVEGKESEQLQEKEEAFVISEHALPFICKELKGKEVDFCVMDDAIYYGGSAKGIAQEIAAFRKIYDIKAAKNAKVKFYAAIQTLDVSLDLIRYIDYPIKAKVVSKPGYSHFFVKRLNEDIRKLETTFEIEFPIVTYTLNKAIKKENLKNVAEDVFGSEAIIYLVEHHENYSINIVFNKTDGCTFKKIRLFPSTTGEIFQVKVVCMAPHSIPDEDITIEHLFDKAESTYQLIWDKVYKACHINLSDINPNNIYDYLLFARYRGNKSLIIMANYLRSFNIFVKNSHKIEDIFRKQEIEPECKGVDAERDLYYLLGNHSQSKEIAKILNKKIYHEQIDMGAWTTDYTGTEDPTYPIFENSEYFPVNTISMMENQNRNMIEKSSDENRSRVDSSTIEEAFKGMNIQSKAKDIDIKYGKLDLENVLSILFFNQDVFYEKQLIQNDFTKSTARLRLGYTFPYLQKTLSDIIRREQVKPYHGENMEKTLHHWTDQRIGEGSIVPHYILDDKSQNWYRVFRHGENEETLLSHTARFVLFVFNERNKKTHLGWIRKEQFENLLSKAFEAIVIDKDSDDGKSDDQKRTKQIVESTNVLFTVSNGRLKYIKVNEESKENKVFVKVHSVLDYMLDMQILAEEPEDRIVMPSRTELYMSPGTPNNPSATTMSSESEENIKQKLNEIQ